MVLICSLTFFFLYFIELSASSRAEQNRAEQSRPAVDTKAKTITKTRKEKKNYSIPLMMMMIMMLNDKQAHNGIESKLHENK